MATKDHECYQENRLGALEREMGAQHDEQRKNHRHNSNKIRPD